MDIEFKELMGKTLTSVKGSGGGIPIYPPKKGDYEIVFETSEGEKYKLYHDQDCCEGVYVEDVIGSMEDLIGNPLLMAEEVSNAPDPEGWKADDDDSYTWTFYKLETVKGYVTIRWYGSSTGYYSESVSFEQL